MSDLSRHHPPQRPSDTPAPGWQRDVWARIQRARRLRLLGFLALAGAAALGGALVAHRPSLRGVARVQVRTILDRARRPDGSAPVPAVWQVHFEGSELRVYRNALGAVRRCPGSTGCVQTAQGGTLELPVDVAGEYRAVAFSAPGPGDGRTLHGDLVAAGERGEPVAISGPLIVY